MDLFDFHYHAFIKPLASGYPFVDKFKKSRNPWRFDKPRIASFEVRLLPKSTFEKLNEFNGTLHISALLSVDYPMICSATFDLADLLGATQTPTLEAMRTNEPIHNLNRKLLVKDAAGQNIREVRDKVHYIKSGDDIQANKINILFSVEGIHSIYKLKVPGLATRDDRAYFQDFSEFELDYDFFRALKQSTFGRVLYMTITHLAYWPLCTHAFGLHPFVQQEDPYITKNIRPRGFGYEDLPAFEQLMDQCFSESYTDPRTQEQVPGKKILLDIKHSSLVSRLQFYALRQKWLQRTGKQSKDYPILASHMGVTGMSYKQVKEKLLVTDQADPDTPDCRVVAYDKRKIESRFGFEFNPSSINLYDEDIKEIIDSGGYIGISADRRILGADKALRRFWKFGKSAWKDIWTFRLVKEFEIFSAEELKCIYAAAHRDLDWLDLADDEVRDRIDLDIERGSIPRVSVNQADQGDEGDIDDHLLRMSTREINQLTRERRLILGQGRLRKVMKFNSRSNEALKRDIMDKVRRGEMLPSEAAITIHLEDDTDISPERLKEMEEIYGFEFEGLEYFINNLVHIIRVGGEAAWERVCLGSDYDGFIDPLPALLTVDKIRHPLFHFKMQLLLAAWGPKEELFLEDRHDVVRKVSQLLVGNGIRLVKTFA